MTVAGMFSVLSSKGQAMAEGQANEDASSQVAASRLNWRLGVFA
jgi:hypothetical protein